MAEFKQIIDDALDILKFDGAVQDTLAELREKWGAQVPALLDERFDAVGVQYMKLSHEKGVAALGQELSAFGWALYNLDDEDEYLFVLIQEEERSEWERYCKKQGQYCHLMKQQGRKWGDHAKEQDPGKLMPCEEYILQDEYDYFFNSLAGDFAAGEWKNQNAEEWKNGCVADLRHRPPQVIRSHSLPHLGCLTYSPEHELYAASRAAGSGTIGRALLSKNPATLNWAEPSPIGYDGPPQTLCWADHSLWVGDPTNATRIELTDRGTCQDVKNWTLPEDGWSTKYHCGIVTDGLGRVYFSNEWYKGQIYRWESGKVTKHTFSLDGYDHLSEAVPVPGTGRITMIHAVSGKGRMEECLLELDMDTGRCRIAPLPGMGEGLKLRWFTGDWLLVQGNGEILSDDFAQLINMNTREVLRIRPEMFGGEKMQHIGILTDGTVVIVTRRDRVGPVFRYPIDFWGFLRTANKPKKLEWREYKEVYPNLPIFLPSKATERKIILKKDSLTILGAVFTPPLTLSQLAEKLGPAHIVLQNGTRKSPITGRESPYTQALALWDELGLQGWLDEDEQTIKTIGVRVAAQGEYAVRQTFDGAVWIGSKDYREASWKDFAGFAHTLKLGGFTVYTRLPGPVPEEQSAQKAKLEALSAMVQISWKEPENKAAKAQKYKLSKPMELFAKRMTWELDNEEGLSCLSFELEDGYFTLSRKTGAETLRLEMNDPANGQLIDPDCFEYALDNTRFRLNIVRNKLSHIWIDHTAVTYDGLLAVAGNNYIKPVAHVQFTKEQMEHFSQLQREKAKKPVQLDEQAASECRSVLSAFFAEMTEGKADNEVLTTDIEKPFILSGGSYYLLFTFSLKSWFFVINRH